MSADDHFEIAGLVARYAELLNLGRIEEVGELFRYGRITSEGNPNTYEGVAGVTEMYRASVVFGEKVPDTLLFTSNLQIEVAGDRANGKAYFVALHEAGGVIQPVVAGRYHDEFHRIEGTWWFHHRHMFADLRGDLSSHLTRPIEDFEQ